VGSNVWVIEKGRLAGWARVWSVVAGGVRRAIGDPSRKGSNGTPSERCAVQQNLPQDWAADSAEG
jgi:hypothetical protein